MYVFICVLKRDGVKHSAVHYDTDVLYAWQSSTEIWLMACKQTNTNIHLLVHKQALHWHVVSTLAAKTTNLKACVSSPAAKLYN